MVQYSRARVHGARGDEAFHELSVPERFHEVPALAHDSQALQVAQLLRRFVRSIREGQDFHPDFDDAVCLHRTIEAIQRSAASGAWERPQ